MNIDTAAAPKAPEKTFREWFEKNAHLLDPEPIARCTTARDAFIEATTQLLQQTDLLDELHAEDIARTRDNHR